MNRSRTFRRRMEDRVRLLFVSEHESDRAFLAAVKAASLDQLVGILPLLQASWQRVAVGRAIERLRAEQEAS